MPARAPGRIAHLAAFANQLRDAPGEWTPYPLTLGADPAKWKSRPLSAASLQSTASRIRNGKVAVFGAGFEARVDADTLLVRYVPEASAA